MPDMYRVEPVRNEDDRTYFEIQIRNGDNWKTMYQYGKPLQFKIERMAIMRMRILETAALHKIPIVTVTHFV
jgi:hypothetical protein